MIESLGETIPLPRDLVRRIVRVVESEALGYGSVDDFILAALRGELKEAERSAYWLNQEGAP